MFILFISVPVFAVSIYLFGKYHNDLVELEYVKYRETWEAEGRPQGWGRSRQETGMQVLGWGRIYTGFNWLIYEPPWIKGDKKAQQLRKQNARLLCCIKSGWYDKPCFDNVQLTIHSSGRATRAAEFKRSLS